MSKRNTRRVLPPDSNTHIILSPGGSAHRRPLSAEQARLSYEISQFGGGRNGPSLLSVTAQPIFMRRGRFRGGSQRRRDRWFGIDKQPDFDDFERWWHRRGKRLYDGENIRDRDQAKEIYDDWIDAGRPKAD